MAFFSGWRINSAVLIFTPIFLPIALDLGIDPVHPGIMMTFNLLSVSARQ
ncbi:TRAP transporter large permease subunit [Vibrio lentus]|nr:TRAP transporter large permease subunit [Vibrio lentus]